MASATAKSLTHCIPTPCSSLNYRVHALPVSPRTKEDLERNLRVLDDAIKKNLIKKEINIERLQKGKFQDNMELLQWAYTYALSINPKINTDYNGYEMRIEASMKQKKGNGIRQ